METICAEATPRGRGGICVIRVSGDDALGTVKKIFRSAKDIEKSKGYEIFYGSVYDGGEKTDDCLVSVFRAPHSYTGEDVCEVSCHGGIVVTEKIISLLLKSGARLATRGEFTRRAFMNGKMSLTEAEAVKDIIDASTEAAAQAAVNRLSGGLSERINDVRGKIISLLASIQASTDFPDEDIDSFAGGKLTNILDEIESDIDGILKSARRGIYLSHGARCAIVGVPNVGKSSLLNYFLDEERVIVSERAGTTRDAVEAGCEIGGVFVTFVDTAGIRATDDEIEKIGVKISERAIEDADFVIFMTEAGRDLTDDERAIIKKIGDKPKVLIKNKCDIKDEKAEDFITISVKTGLNTDKLRSAISEILEEKNNDSKMLSNERQREAVIKARCAVERAMETVRSGVCSDLAAVDIAEAAECLGEAEGMNVTDEVIDKIFAEFCLGK